MTKKKTDKKPAKKKPRKPTTLGEARAKKKKADEAAAKLKAPAGKPPKPTKPKTKEQVAAEKKKLKDADKEQSARFTSTAKRFVKAEAKIASLRKQWGDVVAEKRSTFVDAIEAGETADTTETDQMKSWRKARRSWQAWEEAESGRKEAMHPVLDDIKALKKSMTEQLANLNQLGLPGMS